MPEPARYQPNSISLKVRILCVIWFLALVFYGLTELAIGQFYLPLKRSYFLLNGFPVVLVAFAFFLCSIPALLTLIDHYDKRDNEAEYQYFKKICWLFGAFFFFIAPLSALWMQVYPASMQAFLARIHGFAENYSIYTEDYKRFLPLLNKCKNKMLVMTIPGLLMIVYSFFKFSDNEVKLKFFLTAILLTFVSAFFLLINIEEFLTGETIIGRKPNVHIVKALADPAKFNAIFLTRFTFCGLMVLLGLIGLISVMTGKITSLNLHHLRR